MNALAAIPFSTQAIVLLIASNVFMTMAWYGHLRHMASSPWYVAAHGGAVYFMFRGS